jgi:predicted N-acetyltransferase YhbS
VEKVFSTYTIRPAAAADTDAIVNLTRDVFWKFWEPGYAVHHNHLAISVLRGAKGYVPELDLVAVDNKSGEIIGHIIYTISHIVPATESESSVVPADQEGILTEAPRSLIEEQAPATGGTEVLTFGPLTVKTDRQHAGIGRALVEHSFNEALRLGIMSGAGKAPAVVILGVPDYYPRLGFKRGSEFGLTFAGYSFDALLAYELVPGALDGISGNLVVDPAYAELNPDNAADFDKQFPARELHVPTPIGALSGVLSDDVLEALRAQEVETVDSITGYSQDELAAMTGFSTDELAQVAAEVRKATGQRWGR